MAGGWEARAACRSLKADLFYPGTLSNSSIAQADRARAVCARCPVRGECLDDALSMEKGVGAADREGIRGGLDGRERYALQRGHRLPRRPLPVPDDGQDHGERRTYRKGCRCFECCAAEASKKPDSRLRPRVEPKSKPASRPRVKFGRKPGPGRKLAPCGTLAAYQRHLKKGQDIDPACAAARRSQYSSPRPVLAVRPLCGTRSGYQWHTQHQEIPCPECTAADLAVVWYVREGSAA